MPYHDNNKNNAIKRHTTPYELRPKNIESKQRDGMVVYTFLSLCAVLYPETAHRVPDQPNHLHSTKLDANASGWVCLSAKTFIIGKLLHKINLLVHKNNKVQVYAYLFVGREGWEIKHDKQCLSTPSKTIIDFETKFPTVGLYTAL